MSKGDASIGVITIVSSENQATLSRPFRESVAEVSPGILERTVRTEEDGVVVGRYVSVPEGPHVRSIFVVEDEVVDFCQGRLREPDPMDSIS